MDDTPREQGASVPHPAPDLAAAIRRARTEVAEHSEVVAELRGAELARLEMLAEAMKPVLAQVPDAVDLFDTGLVPGDRPRFFLDMLAFAEMGRDRRTYRFLQDTRHGRIVLAETDKVDAMAETMTAYVARRLVEREQALAADQTIEQAARAYAKEPPRAERLLPRAEAPTAPALARPRRMFFAVLIFIVELLGSMVLFATLAALCYFAWNMGWRWWELNYGL